MEITYLEEEESYDYFTEEELATEVGGVGHNIEPLIRLYLKEEHQLLKVKRVCDGFNQAELSNLLGFGTSTLSEIETGRRNIPKKYAERIDSYLYDEVYENKELKGLYSKGCW